MPKNVAPRGLPTERSLVDAEGDCIASGSEGAIDVLRRNSWVTAIPMLAKESEVRSHARNVRSEED